MESMHAQDRSHVAARQDLRFGYNHNFRYRGRLFHIQTEDSGPLHTHIYSHIFFAGTVIASKKTEYDRFGVHSRADIQALMRQSHREMCITLRDGTHDERIAALSRRPGVPRRRPKTHSSLPAVVATPKLESFSPEFADDDVADLEATRKCLATIQNELTGFLGGAVVDHEKGTTVRAEGGTLDMKTAVSGNIELLQSKMRLLELLDLQGTLEDILLTLEGWFCIIRPLTPSTFIYVVVDRARGNLAMARRVVSNAGLELKR